MSPSTPTRAPLVTGERALLRLPTETDREEYLALRRASAEFHRAWEPTPPAGSDPYSEESFAAYLSGSRCDRRLRTLICQRDQGAIVGALNFNEIARGAFQNAILGYWIGAPFARQGYMREGLELGLHFAFGEFGLHRVEANIRPENAASIALVAGAGFRREGFSPRYLAIDGDWRDHERWAMTADEWPATHRG